MRRANPDRQRLLDELAERIRDTRVLAAIAAVPRELFVPEELRDQAWRNGPLPIGEGQTISQPLVVARMCEALELSGNERILDVGTGSGYHAAVLSRLSAYVYSIERHRSLSEEAAIHLQAAGITNVELLVGDGSRGHPEAAPYDAISVAAATRDPSVLAELAGQLAEGGRLIAPSDGDDDDEHLVLVERRGGALHRTVLEPVRFVRLVRGVDDTAGT